MYQCGEKWSTNNFISRFVNGSEETRLLIDSYNHTVDSKGRVFVPAKWRQDLGDGFVLTRGIDGCLFGLPMEEWDKLSAKLASLPFTNKSAQSVQRNLTRWASECDMDKQGRVLVSPKLRELAKIESEIVFIGMTNHFELWSPEALSKVDEEQGDDYDASFEAAAEFGI